jgi:hypothetical protein
LSGLALTLAALVTAPAVAKSWCAAPLVVHEWGVQVFRGPEASPAQVELPDWFHTLPGSGRWQSGGVPVRSLPADGGEREIPVLQFYAPPVFGAVVPVAVELGFTAGRPSVGYPRFDRVFPPRATGDPGVQLAWDALSLEVQPRAAPHAPAPPWIDDLRAVDGALWVNRGDESERFLFYEADTREQPRVRLEADRVRNTGAWPVHDLAVVRRVNGQAEVARLERLEAGGAVTLSFEPVADPGAIMRPWLSERLLAEDGPDAVRDWSMDMDDCVMMRDPAVPESTSAGHGLYQPEIDAMLDLWQARLFGQQGTVLLYRDDPVALDALVPMAVYTDMHHFVRLSRTGLVLWEGLEPEARSRE